jgi:hypothetical protein
MLTIYNFTILYIKGVNNTKTNTLSWKLKYIRNS